MAKTPSAKDLFDSLTKKPNLMRGDIPEKPWMETPVQFEKGKYFLEDNYNEIEKIQLRLDKNPDATFSGKLAEVHEEWQSIIENRKTLERTVQGLNRELEKEELREQFNQDIKRFTELTTRAITVR